MTGFEQFLGARLAQLREELLAEHVRWASGLAEKEASTEADYMIWGSLAVEDSIVPPGLLSPKLQLEPVDSPMPSMRSLGVELRSVGPPLLPGEFPEPDGEANPKAPSAAPAVMSGVVNDKVVELPLRTPHMIFTGDSEALPEAGFGDQPKSDDDSPASVRTDSKTSSEVRMSQRRLQAKEQRTDEPLHFTVLHVWKAGTEDFTRSGSFGCTRTHQRISLAHCQDAMYEDHGQIFSTSCPWLEKMIIKPDSLKHTVWVQLGTLIAIYEMVMIPMVFFKIDELPIILTVNWFVRIYWLLDMLISFITGYYLSDGRCEVRPERIAWNYFSSWLPFDATIIILDWVDVIMRRQPGLGKKSMWRLLKAFRLLRMLRYVKVASNFKLPEFLSTIVYQFQNETWSIAFEICKLTFLIAWVTHFFACCWWGIGYDMTGHSLTWVMEHGLEEEPFALQYTTAFHWSLTQFTGSMEVYPVNVTERAFADVVLLTGFLIGAWVVSLITASMTRLQMVTAHQATQVSSLRQYLQDNCISSKLALRVQRHAKDALALEKKKTPESSIELLALISEPMRIELHYEIFKPFLTLHPFLLKFDSHDPSAFRRICHLAVSKTDFTRGDIIFCAGDQGHDATSEQLVRFVTKGKLDYTQHGATFADTETAHVEQGAWISEQVLWTQWVHCGDLRTTSECSMLNLSALKFQEIAKKTHVNNQPEHPVLNYAHNFVKQLNMLERSQLSDLDTPDLPVWEITGKAFPRGSSASSMSSEDSLGSRQRAMLRRGISRTMEFNTRKGNSSKSFQRSSMSRSRVF